MTKTTDKITLQTLRKLKAQGEPIACLTAYDATFAHMCDAAGVDLILVGDSLGMVVQGRANTVAVTVDDMAYHGKCVANATRRAFVMIDMPFMSAATTSCAVENASRLMRETGANGVKIEFGEHQAGAVEALSANGIPVCAHLGLRPQWIHEVGGFKQQGKSKEEKERLHDLAQKAIDAGASMLLLECVPDDVASKITDAFNVPVIGIGAGVADGQIMVLYDILGMGKTPYFARDFLSEQQSIAEAIKAYVAAVKQRDFPPAE